MSRLIICVALILCCCFVMSGCRVCSSPYLYCGPVDDMSGGGCGSCGGSSCDPLYRSGSALNGYRGGGYYDGNHAVTAQPFPYTDENVTPIKQMSQTQAAPSRNIKSPPHTQATPAREFVPSVSPGSSYSTPSNLPSVPPPSLSRELLLQQERGAIDAKIIDVQDNIYSPTSYNMNTRANHQVRQVAYEDVQW